MSVPVNERTQGKLEVCVKAHDLACYTLKITVNKKIFTADYQDALTDKFMEGIKMTVIRRGTSPQDQALQDNAIAMAQKNADIIEYIAMMTDVEIPSEEDAIDEQEV